MSAELHLRRGWDGYQLLLTAPLQVVLDGESVGPIGMRASNEYSIEPGVHTLEVVKGRRRSRRRTFMVADGDSASFVCRAAYKMWPVFLVSTFKPDWAIWLRRE